MATFEILGPVMIGPSSSHTAGVCRIALTARELFNDVPKRAEVRFYGSLAATGRGHRSGDAAIAGLLGFYPDNEEVARGRKILAEMLAQRKGFPVSLIEIRELPPSWHPNTMSISLFGDSMISYFFIRAASIGGGSIRIEEVVQGDHHELES
jgi:L-serine dehydratase